MRLVGKPARVAAALAVLLFATGCAERSARNVDVRRDYLTTRARYARTMDSLYARSPTAAFQADSAAVWDLAGRLRTILGPFAMAGVTDTGTINLGTFISGNIGTDLPDGIVYRGPAGSRVFVTDTMLVHAWIAHRYGAQVPSDLAGALATTDVATFAFPDDEAAVVRYAALPVVSTRMRVYSAHLIDRAQDDCVTCAPRFVLVTVGWGSRIVIADAPVSVALPVPAPCVEAARGDAQAHPRDDGHDRFVRLLRCYDTAARADPRVRPLVAKAQWLIDALPSAR